MAAVIATCFSLSLLLGNICPMQLTAFAAQQHRMETKTTEMTPVHGEQMACSKKAVERQPSAFSIPNAHTCTSGHCLAKSDPTAWLQLALPSPLSVTAPATDSSPSPLTAFIPAPRNRFISSTGPPPRLLRTIVLRI